MDTLVTAVSTTLDDNYNMLVDYKEEEDEEDNKDNSPVITILTTAQILEIDSSLQISNIVKICSSLHVKVKVQFC